MLEKKIWAVIGANRNPEKFGNIIYKRLKDKGYVVYPVNPTYETIEGDKCYNSISEMPVKPEVINMVVSPKNGVAFIKEAINLGINNIWFQPGTFDKEIFKMLKNKNVDAIQACVLVETD